jgi:hypothetical protein
LIVPVAVAASLAAVVPALAGPGDRTAAGNHRAAVRDAKQLLTRVVLPPGLGSGPRPGPAEVKIVDQHAFWKVDQPFQQVLHYVEAHRPKGGRLLASGSSGGPGQPIWEFVIFQFPSRPGVLGTRWLMVSLIQVSRRSTGVRVDGQVQWIIPRPPGEKVPAGVEAIHVSRSGSSAISRMVTDPAQVQNIVRLVDRLPTVQPGVVNCPYIPANAPTVHFLFRGGDGRLLAQASMLTYDLPAGPCNDMAFTIGARPETPLLAGGRFLHKVGRVVGVQLTVPRPR